MFDFFCFVFFCFYGHISIKFCRWIGADTISTAKSDIRQQPSFIGSAAQNLQQISKMSIFLKTICFILISYTPHISTELDPTPSSDHGWTRVTPNSRINSFATAAAAASITAIA